MRASVTRERIERLMDRLGRAASVPARVYLVGGTSAVLLGWRLATIDVDLAMRPHDDALLRAIPAAKEELDINVELASPADFIPLPLGWEDRSPLIAKRFVASDARVASDRRHMGVATIQPALSAAHRSLATLRARATRPPSPHTHPCAATLHCSLR